MKSTAIQIEFQVNDLTANYEVFGTSDNYSFQNKIGRGSDLVDFEGETASKIISLKGNYGIFEIKVFAVTDLGIRSEFVIGSINVNPPEFEGTFTFNNLQISYDENKDDLSPEIYSAPQEPGDTLIVRQQFENKEAFLSWNLTPPVGHAYEGQSVSTELLTDTFFSGFVVNFKKDGEYISSDILNASSSLQASDVLSTSEVDVALNNYRSFNLNISEGVFDDLELGRNVDVEIVSVDKFGGTATGIISGYNAIPDISNFLYSLNGPSMSFSWSCDDEDYSHLKIQKLYVPEYEELNHSGDMSQSIKYFAKRNEVIDRSITWNSNGQYYNSGAMALYDGSVYESIVPHASSPTQAPSSSDNWIYVGNSRVDYGLSSFEKSDFTFESTQFWGYKYYYSVQVFDEIGGGDIQVVSEGGTLVPSGLYEPNFDITTLQEGEEVPEPSLSDLRYMFAFESTIEIGNLRFEEKKDNLVFYWDVIDQDGNIVDLESYKMSFKEGDVPTLIGISGSLFDTNTKEILTGISEGGNSKSLGTDEGGDTVVRSDLPSAQIFNTFEYTRQINNDLYGEISFPDNYVDYQEGGAYNAGDFVLANRAIYKSILDNNEQTPNVKPIYYDWDKSKSYTAGDCVVYKDDIYNLLQNFGQDYINLFDFDVSYSVGDFVLSPSVYYSKYDAANEYLAGDIVVHNGGLYKAVVDQGPSSSVYAPDSEDDPWDDYWSVAATFDEIDCNIYKAVNSTSQSPVDSNSDWELQDPESSNAFELYIEYIKGAPAYEWSDQNYFVSGDYAIYNNDVWFCLQDNGLIVDEESEEIIDDNVQIPSEGEFWTNSEDGQDIVYNYSAGDLIYYSNAVYKSLSDNPTCHPLIAADEAGQSSSSSYEDSNWVPYWEEQTQYQDAVYRHIGFHQSGKRSIGLELAIVNSLGDTFSKTSIEADNPPPYILSQGFNVDSLSEASKVKFKFNYALAFQEKTTKVNLYRSTEPVFDITGSDGRPFSSIHEAGSNLVQVFLGAGDANFGDNITELVDSPPVFIDDDDGIEYPTGYYYKILPYDDFGSGVLYNVSDNAGGLDKVIVYPTRFNNPNPNAMPGRVLRTEPEIAGGFVPGPVENFSIQTSFENFFLDWSVPGTEYENSSKLLKQVPNDIDHYEVWMGDEKELKISTAEQTDVLWEAIHNTGYRKIEGVIYSVGEIPYEVADPALEVSNAENILNVSANGLSTEVVYPGETNVTKYFWVRPVDAAGNKGPFTGASPTAYSVGDEGILGMESIPGQAKTTDIADFEQNITQTFPNTVALVPNNPFKNNFSNTTNATKNGTVSWDQHFVYYNGDGYLIHADETEDPYIYWSATGQIPTHGFTVRDITQDELDNLGLGVKGGGSLDSSINNPLRNLKYVAEYDTSSWHPAGQGNSTEQSSQNYDGTDSDPYNNEQYPKLLGETDDFIIARNANGIATTMWHAFANATIGTAHIDDAAITSAKVHTLTADKIRSAEIRGQDIQVGGDGQIRNAGFLGLDARDPANPEEQQEGFAVSGDGSFVFQSKDGKLFFDGDSLTLFGKLRQYDGTEYTFTDLTAEPASFFYVEQSDGTYIPANRTQTCDVTAAFQNSYIEPNEVRWTITRPNGQPFFTYDEFFNSYNEEEGRYSLSGFHYDPDDFYGGDINDQRGPGVARIAKAVLDVTGFERMVRFDDDGNATSILPQDTSVILSVSGVNTSMQRTIAIDFVADGASAVYVDLNTENQIFKYDYDGDYDDELKTLQLNAQAYNTFGDVRYDFYTGVNLANLVNLRTESNDNWSLDNGIAILSNLDQSIPTVDFTPFVARVAVMHENININGEDEDLLLATDFLTIYGSQPGKDSYTVLLDNENHTYQADEYARVPDTELSRGATQVEFKRGHDVYNFVPFDQERFDDSSFNYPLKSYTIKDDIIKESFSDGASVTLKVEKVNPAGTVIWKQGEDVTDSIVTAEGQARITLESIPDSMREESFLTIPVDDCKYVKNASDSIYPPVQFIKSYTFSKTIEGKKGRKIDLSVTDQTIEYDTIGNNPTPNIATVKINAFNFHNTAPQFIFYTKKAGENAEFEQVLPAVDGQRTTQTTYDYTPPANFYNANIPMIVKCEAYDSQEGNDAFEKVAEDQITIFGLKNGSNGISIVQSQESSLIAVSDAGGGVFSLDFENTKNSISVFEGTNQFTYDESLSSENTFKITASTPDDSPITFSQDSTNKNQFIVTAWNDLTESRSNINFLVEIKDSDGQSRSFNRTQAISISKSGVSPRAVKLSATKQGVSYSSKDHTTTVANDSITLTAEPKNTVGTNVFYKYITTDGSTLKIGTANYDGGWTTSNTVVYTPPSVYPGSDDNILSTITCLYTEQNSATAITMAEDSVTIFALKAGTDALTIILSNETHAIPWDTDNDADLSGSNTNVEVFQGADKLTPVAYGAGAGQADSYGDLSNGQFYVDTDLSEAITHDSNNITIDSTNKILKFPDLKTFDTTSMAAERKFTIYAKNFEPTPVTASVVRSQTFSIAKSSPPVRSVRISTNNQAIPYNDATKAILDSSLNTDGIDINSIITNTYGTVYYRWSSSSSSSGALKKADGTDFTNGDWVSSVTAVKYYPDATYSSATLTTITLDISENQSDVLSSDQLSIFATKGGKDGNLVILSNETHSIPWDSDKKGDDPNADVSGSGTDIQVFQGDQVLNSVASNATLTNGTFKVSSSVGSEGALNKVGAQDVSDNTKVSFADLSGFSDSDTGKIVFTIEGKNKDGTTFTTTKTQTFSLLRSAPKVRSVSITASNQNVSYSSIDNTATTTDRTVTVTAATPLNTVYDVYYRWSSSGGSITKTSGAAITGWTQETAIKYTAPETLNSDNPKLTTITCEIAEDANGSTIFSSDQVTIFGNRGGKDGNLVILSNETHSIPWNTDASTATLTGSGTDIQVFQGDQVLNSVASNATLTNGTFKVSSSVGSEGALNKVGAQDVSDNTKVSFADLSGFSDSDTGKIVFTIDGKNKDGTSFTTTKTQTFSLLRSAPKVRSVSISPTASSSQIISYRGTDGARTGGSIVDINASVTNTHGTVYYKWISTGDSLKRTNNTAYTEGTWVAGLNSIRYSTPSTFSDTDLTTITCYISENSDGSTVLDSDQISIFGAISSVSPVSAILSNEAHQLAWDGLSANPDYGGSGTQIKVYEGNTPLTAKKYGTSAGQADSLADLSAGQFYAVPSANNITSGAQSASGTTLTIADHSSFVFAGDNRAAYVDFTIYAKRSDGTTTSITKRQNLSINEKGDVGGFPAYRGTWSSTTQYYGSTLSSKRADIVLYSSEYYIALRDNLNKQPNTSTSDWQAFGASFSNVATSFLMVDNSTVKNTITLADGTATGDIGRIQTYKFDGDGDPQGFRAGLNEGTLEFYAGTTSSYIKFDNGETEKIRIKNAYIANSTIASADSISGGAISGSTITGTGAISGASLSVGTGAISGGAISGASLSVGSGAISGGAITGASLSVTGDVTAYSGSDKRLKDNISNIENALEKIIKLNAIEFTWNHKQSFFTGNDVGLIAQEVQELGFNIVKERADGYLGLRYEKMIPFLVAAIKEQQEIIEEMEFKISQLESKN